MIDGIGENDLDQTPRFRFTGEGDSVGLVKGKRYYGGGGLYFVNQSILDDVGFAVLKVPASTCC